MCDLWEINKMNNLLLVLGLTVLFVLCLRPVAVSAGLVDAPDVRKRHDGAVPLIGGLVIYAALAVSTLTVPAWSAHGGLALIVLGLPLLVIGVLDDRWSLSPRARFAVEILVCVLAASYIDIRIDSLGSLLPGVALQLGWLALPITIIGLVGVINAFNMTDGVDGLAGGLSLLIFGALAVFAHRADADIALQLMSIAAAVFGFLLFNSRFFGRARAAIFMGDGGTLFVGFAIGWYLVLLSQGERAVIQPVTALWLFAVPLLDTVSLMIRRIRRGQSPFAADREHLHHIFLLAGFGVNGTVLIILGAQALMIGYAFASLSYGIPEWVSFALFLGLFALYYYAMSHAWALMKRIKHFREWAGFEDRRAAALKASANGRRQGGERRRGNDPAYTGPERRSGHDRREISDRRLLAQRREEAARRNNPDRRALALALLGSERRVSLLRRETSERRLGSERRVQER